MAMSRTVIGLHQAVSGTGAAVLGHAREETLEALVASADCPEPWGPVEPLQWSPGTQVVEERLLSRWKEGCQVIKVQAQRGGHAWSVRQVGDTVQHRLKVTL
jgi:hypothetical protein